MRTTPILFERRERLNALDIANRSGVRFHREHRKTASSHRTARIACEAIAWSTSVESCDEQSGAVESKFDAPLNVGGIK